MRAGHRVGSMAVPVLSVVIVLGSALHVGAAPSAPRITLGRTVGPPTTNTSLRGSDFGSSEIIDVFFDGVVIRHARTGPGGKFLTRITIPAAAPPGRHTVSAVGETSGQIGQATFTVRTDWARFHFDLPNTGFNPYENVLSPSTVPNLKWKGRFNFGMDDSAVTSGGILYLAASDGNLYAYRLATENLLWTFRTSHGFFSTPAVVDGVVYVGSGDFNVYAIDARTGAEN